MLAKLLKLQPVVLTINQSYNPSRLVLSKAEILAEFDRAIMRVSKSPGNLRFSTELKLVKRIVSWTSEEKFPYYWQEIKKIFDAVTTLNDLRLDSQSNPKIKPLVEIARENLQRAIVTVPKVNSEYDAMKVLARAKATMSYGGMK